MSTELFSHSPDLRRLREEGYFVQVRGGYLVLREVPYVNERREVLTGALISTLTLAGDTTRTPDTHAVYFDGDYPCHADGTPINGIRHSSPNQDLGHGLLGGHMFSSKPDGGYVDYYHKLTTYASILSGQASVLRPGVTPRVFRAPDDDEDSVFNYVDTTSGRAGIGALTERLRRDRIAIIGLGGTGSYILDLVAKTPVREVKLFDPDDLLQHNAFRGPGAPSLDELRDAPKKVDYWRSIYSRMHRNILAYPVELKADNLDLLNGVTFAFLSLDAGEPKRLIIEKLETLAAGFIDVGMGLGLDEGSLGGILRVTTSTPEKRDHVRQRVPLTGGGADDLYSTNIQVADLNALNANLAVVRWKKTRAFYRDLEHEYHCTYTTDGNQLENGDRA